MWNLIITKWFCHHKWKTHIKEVTNQLSEIGMGRSKFILIERNTEILICTECGKIKKIEY